MVLLGTPSHSRSEFIVMITAVCIIHAGMVAMLMTSGEQEASSAVNNSVCLNYS